MLTLFEIASREWWNSIMYNAIDSVDEFTGPIRDNKPYIGLYFVSFMIVGGFFMMNLFVGYVIYSFGNVKSQMDGLHVLSDLSGHANPV